MSSEFIKIRGARVNNLKNIDIDIPRNKLVVITGLSGSGKSSLAFDTIYAEGQRRYVESLSAYSRQFVGLMDKPDVDLIEGLSPAISIDQRTVGNNPRSTVGTITEIYDYFRLLYSKVGVPYCPDCQVKLKKDFLVDDNKKEKKQSSAFLSCPNCDFKREKPESRDFSFNSSYGACSACGGLGTKMEFDENLIFNFNLSIDEGAIKPLTYNNSNNQNTVFCDLKKVANRNGFTFSTAIKDLSCKQKEAILHGDNFYSGLLECLMSKYLNTKSNFVKQELEKAMRVSTCSSCKGLKLKKESLAVKVKDLNISQLANFTIGDLKDLFFSWQNEENAFGGKQVIVKPIIKEVFKNLDFLSRVGLNYLSLSRNSASLSGGEAQRIRLASQVGSTLSGVLYVLDEPSIGLHQRDNDKLIETLKNLRDNDNTVIVVEHDEATMLAADHLIDIGPGAGECGGEVIFSGKPEDIKNCAKSITGDYLSGRKKINKCQMIRSEKGKSIKIIGASEHNLKNIDVEIPLGKVVAITGVSGSGKSTIMTDILSNFLNKKFYRAKARVGDHKEIIGLENINKVIDIDQSAIGRTPRSNPATYTGLFTYIRDLYASLPEAKMRGFSAGHFSFNVPGGRCENCSGDGVIKVEMQFLSDVYLTCDVCNGHRFKERVLAIKYQGKNIYDVLNMTVREAMSFFRDQSALYNKLETLNKVGLGYIRLGQSATTFSGGEAQRIKLATELSRRSTGKTLYILDEPTTGLHFSDIDKLLHVLNLLVNQGNSVLIIEHNLDVIKSVDWIIDLGPDGGKNGGEIVAQGTPSQVAKVKNSYTGKYLKDILD